MRAARLITRLPPATGGKEIHGAELTRALAAAGVEQHVFCRIGDPVSAAVAQSSPPGRGEPWSRRDMAMFLAWVGPAVRREHARRPFDVIHVHGDYPEALIAARLSGRLGIPAVLTLHGGFTADRARTLLRLPGFAAMHQIWSVSGAAARAISDLGLGVPTIVHPSGVREAFFRPRAPNAHTGPVVTVGRLSAVKGLEYLIAAHDRLGAGGGREWIVAAAGGGAYAEGIRAEIDRRPGIKLVSLTAAEPLAEMLSRAAVFVLPSVDLGRIQEGVPTALLEAIAVSVPVVATRTGGLGEILVDGCTALLVPPGDPDALASAIRATIADPEAGAARAARALGADLARPWSRVADRALGVYEAAIAATAEGVLIVAPWNEPAGAADRAAEIAGDLAARNVPVTVAAAGRDPALDSAVGFQPLRAGRGPEVLAANIAVLTGALARLRPGAVSSLGLAPRIAVRAAVALSGRRAREIRIHRAGGRGDAPKPDSSTPPEAGVGIEVGVR